MDRDMCLNSKCVMKTKCLRYMGKADAIQSYTPFIPMINMIKGFSCVGKVSMYLNHNKKHIPKNSAEYVDLDYTAKVIEEATDYRITEDLNIISTKGKTKAIRPINSKGTIIVRLIDNNGKRKDFNYKKLIEKYYPSN